MRSSAIRMVVVLPEPFGPRNPKISPRCSSKDTPFTTRRPPNVLTSSRTSRAGLAGEFTSWLSVSFLIFVTCLIRHLSSIVPVTVRPVNSSRNELITGKGPTPRSVVLPRGGHTKVWPLNCSRTGRPVTLDTSLGRGMFATQVLHGARRYAPALAGIPAVGRGGPAGLSS